MKYLLIILIFLSAKAEAQMSMSLYTDTAYPIVDMYISRGNLIIRRINPQLSSENVKELIRLNIDSLMEKYLESLPTDTTSYWIIQYADPERTLPFIPFTATYKCKLKSSAIEIFYRDHPKCKIEQMRKNKFK